MVEVEVARKGGERATLRVPLQRAAQAQTASATDGTRQPSKGREERAESSLPSLGITVAPLDAATARQLDLPADVRGVMVTDVDDASPAAGRIATPQTGGPDVILSVEGQPVTTPESLRAALGSAKAGDIVTLRIYNAQAKNRRIERVRLGASAGR
jgi:serine protease Do